MTKYTITLQREELVGLILFVVATVFWFAVEWIITGIAFSILTVMAGFLVLRRSRVVKHDDPSNNQKA